MARVLVLGRPLNYTCLLICLVSLIPVVVLLSNRIALLLLIVVRACVFVTSPLKRTFGCPQPSRWVVRLAVRRPSSASCCRCPLGDW